MATVVLVCAVLAATAAGVLIAYIVCHTMFGIFRIHARQAAVRAARHIVGEPQIAEL